MVDADAGTSPWSSLKYSHGKQRLGQFDALLWSLGTSEAVTDLVGGQLVSLNDQ